ncbi:tripartite tricarboxylate transporter TctB family protein [Billgrantia endophytica]|uniref:tripartite tricarboxylate transporter TctB family protein n=1 Tax=Billgrantia endophytica TaxID=2033802 RepID=UPI0013FE2AE7|nr:tripartite tricarboxylate transporter TctB family protein [Halomonas endophytica]
MKNLSVGGLVVPVTMLSFTLAYWWQAYGLSFEARLFPLALSLALLTLMAGNLVQFLRHRDSRQQPEKTSRHIARRRALVVALPVLLLLAWSQLGGFVFVWLAVLALQWALGERRPISLAALPLGSAVALYLLFSTLLHARVPMGLLGVLVN